MNFDQNANFAKDIVDSGHLLDNAIDYITTRYSPEDIFSTESLEVWACENGYIKESEIEENLG